MTYADLVKNLATQNNMTQSDVRNLLNSFQDTVVETTKAGEKVNLSVLGAFGKADRAPRKGHNPKTGDSIDIPARTVPVFKPSRWYKTSISD